MSIKGWVREFLNKIFISYGYEILRRDILYDWQKIPENQPTYNIRASFPEGALTYLKANNPLLKDLRKRYSEFDKRVTEPLIWTNDLIRDEDILYFRGDNAYVWQLRGPNMNAMSYALTFYYVQSIDKLELLSQLEEDDFFGNFTFKLNDKLISRDLLDSIIEIYFLEKHLHLSSHGRDFNILDIGAGYGRLAHRMLHAFPCVKKYFCTDAIPESTFISDYYLRYRKIQERAKVLPLDEIKEQLKNYKIDLAINIHSFSECTVTAIEWWVTLLAKHNIPFLMIVPNAQDHGGKFLQTNNRKDIQEILERHGYRLMVKEAKYRDPIVQKYAINPGYYYLFELN